MKERVEHPDVELQEALRHRLAELVFINGPFVEGIKKRVDEHNLECKPCGEVSREVVKFY